MEQNKKWVRLSYKSAIFFFLITFLINLTLTPAFVKLGVSQQTSVFVLNSLSISITLSYVLLVMNKMYQNKKQALLLGSIITILSTAFCYYVIYLS